MPGPIDEPKSLPQIVVPDGLQARERDQLRAYSAPSTPFRLMWHRHGISWGSVAKRTWNAVLADRLFGHAAELGFYFLFALFPTLFCAGSMLGLAARSAHQISDRLLHYLALVIPTTALGMILSTFNETAAAATSGKVTFSSIAAVWSASVGISAIQDTLNEVYKLEDSRSYLVARIDAIVLTIFLTFLVIAGLGCMLGGDFFAALAVRSLKYPILATATAAAIRIVAWSFASCILALSFEVLYCWAPGWKRRRWHWLTPGTTFGVVGWLLASLGFRAYIHYFNTYTVTYGSLGAVIILLMWFYISGLMLLLGAEINTVLDVARNEVVRG
jgi:membrane protein